MIAISQKQNLIGANYALLLIYLLGRSVFQCTLASGLHILMIKIINTLQYNW